MKTVLFLTSSYPYFPGEQFIEDEIGYWAEQSGAKIVLIPWKAFGIPRNIPAEIDVDLTLAKSSSLLGKLASVVKASISKLFWKEVRFIYISKGLNMQCYAQALKSVAQVVHVEKALKNIYSKHQGELIAYSYWNEVQAYATVNLKRSGLISKVVSRAHGFDVYENRRPSAYMPLKRQFINDIDSILAISKQGKSYIELTYDASPEKVLISPLGVPLPPMLSIASETDNLNIVSISFCVAVKRIDKIIDAIAEAALKLNSLKITWTHIGDGPLLADLKIQADEKLSSLEVEWKFLGNKPNAEVKKYFENNSVDIFINTSESEGVPVSIMEAMSYGVPVIAPNVGGIAELVSNDYGCLLSETPSVPDIATAIMRMSSKFKLTAVRELAKKKIISDYNARKNYKALVDLIVS